MTDTCGSARRTRFLLPGFVVMLCTNTAWAQGYQPEEAADRMTVTAGFSVQLFAAEPMVRQPVAIELDDRGRLWTIQLLQYPMPAGLKRVGRDRWDRTIYDRVPLPPPHGPKGADRITILEDTDGDGRADMAKDFVSGLNLATGLAFGYGGVFVLQVPYLLFYPDRDRNDLPDTDPDVLLKGFGMHDAAAAANSLTWGPDGWLYGTQGTTVTAEIRGIEFQQGVWRYHPITKEFELFCEGGGNSWGLDFDRNGNLLYSTNYGGFLMCHAVQGAYYLKSFAKHGDLHNPYTFGYFDHVPHENFRGGHVTVGGIVYQGDAFPPRFRDKYIGADLLGNALYWHEIRARGSTFQSNHLGELCLANDTWFAPSDVVMGSDGAVYLADWHDKRTAHPDPDAVWDRSNGRIYRLQAVTAQPAPHVDLNTLPSRELIDWIGHSNDWYVRRARRILAQRHEPSTWEPLLQTALQSQEHHLALQALWALYVSGGFDEAVAEKLLAHPSEHLRAWTVRFLGDAGQVSPTLADTLIELAVQDPSVHVRSQLACTAKRLPATVGLAIAHRILLRNEDSQDPYLPLLLWWALEKHSVSSHDLVERLFVNGDVWKSPMIPANILPRLMKRYAAAATERSYLSCAQLLDAAPTTSARGQLLAALDEGMAMQQRKLRGMAMGSLFKGLGVIETGHQTAKVRYTQAPQVLKDRLEKLWRDNRSDTLLARINLRLGNQATHQYVLHLAMDRNGLEERRIAMLGILRELGQQECVGPLLQLLRDESDPSEAVRLAAVDVLKRFNDTRVANTLFEIYPLQSAKLRASLRELLLSRKASAQSFLRAVDQGKYDPSDVEVEELRVIAVYKDEELTALVRKHWGNISSGTPEEKLAEMRRLKNDLRAGGGDPVQGHALYQKHCASCHRLFNEGDQIGPDLTTANRNDQDALLVSLVDPGRLIRREYLNWIVILDDGRTLTGVVVKEGPGTVTLADVKGKTTVVARSAIDEMQATSTSLMPDNILRELSPQQLRDLFSYLQK